MKFLLSVIILLVLTLGCSENPEVKNFKFQIAPENPPIIFASFVKFYQLGEEIVEVEVTGPSMVSQFNVVNNNNRTITLVSAEFRVTGPDGKERVASLLEDQSGGLLFNGSFRAENDINCDGLVTVEDDTAVPPINCALDNNNPSFLGLRYYVYDLLQGVSGTDIDALRGGSFDFTVRLEGWVGSPTAPEKSFFKIVNFTVSSNP